MTMYELINYVKLRNKEYMSRPSAPEVDLPIVKMLREGQVRSKEKEKP